MYLPPKADDEEWIGIIIAMPDPWVTQLTQIRQLLGEPSALKVPPHITLIPPVAVNVAKREQILTHLQNVASTTRSFRVKVEDVETFLPRSPVAYLGLREGGPACSSLASQLRAGPLFFEPRFDYHPHVTLMQDLTEEKLQLAKELTAGLTAQWTVPGFRLDNIDADGIYTSRALFNFAL